jgi:hypothetical protein
MWNNTNNFTAANNTANSQQQWNTLQQTLITNTYILFFFLLVFSCLQKRCAHVYKARWVKGIAKGMIPPNSNCIGWIKHTLMISNDHIFRHSGLDALALIMVIEMALQLFFLFMILNVSILTFGYNKLSMNTICYGSDLLWGHWTLATLMVFTMMWLVSHQWDEFSKYRRRYLIELRDAAVPTSKNKKVSTIPILAIHGRAVVVKGLPQWMNKDSKDPDKDLYDFFDRLFPGKVDSACVARNPGKELTQLMEERDLIRDRLEIAMSVKRTCKTVTKEGGKVREEPKYKPPLSLKEMKNKAKALKNKIPIPGAEKEGKDKEGKEEDLTKLTNTEGIKRELEDIEKKLSAISKDTNTFEVYEENTGYVVFLTAVGQSLAIQSLLTTPWEKREFVDHKNGEATLTKFRTAPNLTVEPAPEPRDVVHDNVGAPTFKRYACGISPRVVVMRALSSLLLFFWAIPVALITSLTQLDVLEKFFPFISILTSIPVIRNFLSGFLPTLALVQFMSNLPSIFAWMAKIEGTQSYTEIDASATSRYVWFQIVNVLFVSALTGDILSRLSQIISQPASLINLLGTAIPGTYMFFTSYIMLMAFAVYPLELSQVSSVILKKYKMKKAKTFRQWKSISAAPMITGGYAKQYGYVMLAFSISMEFATVAPMLLPFSVLFFGFCYICLRHQIYYVYGTANEGVGRIFPWLMYTICIITVVCLLTLIGIFYGRQAPIQATMTWPIVFLVLIFWYKEQKSHSSTFNTLSLQELVKSENTQTKSLVPIIKSNCYTWLVDHNIPNKTDLINGISIADINAAQIYLHPTILRHRLGIMNIISEEEEERLFEQMKIDNNRKDTTPVSFHGNVLPMKRHQDVKIFGQTFFDKGHGGSNKKRRSTANFAVGLLNNDMNDDRKAVELSEEIISSNSIELNKNKDGKDDEGEDDGGENDEGEDDGGENYGGEDDGGEDDGGKDEGNKDDDSENLNAKETGSMTNVVNVKVKGDTEKIEKNSFPQEEISEGTLYKSRFLMWLITQLLAIFCIVAIFLYAVDNPSMVEECKVGSGLAEGL